PSAPLPGGAKPGSADRGRPGQAGSATGGPETRQSGDHERAQETAMEQTTEPVDALIGQVEKLYLSLTGQGPPPPREAPYAPIPPEKDPERHLAEQVDRLLASLGPLSPGTPLAPVW